ncbi:hypothetical protein CLU99_0031 [Flavobacterium sp. 2]|nr:hypothetical protein CLU99_0031 [Flavobacterium sp. 2]
MHWQVFEVVVSTFITFFVVVLDAEQPNRIPTLSVLD